MAKINRQMTLAEMDQEYEQFVEKFKPKRTTDDCFTPPNIYETVLMWVVQEYGIDPQKVVRPFWPGGSYETQDYPEGCTVVDNPPFSIITKIARTYMEAGIRFFLFAPYLTNFQIRAGGVTHIITDATITYENGAKVNTAFVTNLDPEFRIRTAPDLRAAIMAVEEENTRGKKKDIPKYSYPPEVITATQAGFISRYGIDLRIRDGEACWVKDLDSQKEKKKQIFGGGYLLSESAAARKAEAEQAAGRLKAERETAATCWELSDRERGIIKAMERRSDK